MKSITKVFILFVLLGFVKATVSASETNPSDNSFRQGNKYIVAQKFEAAIPIFINSYCIISIC